MQGVRDRSRVAHQYMVTAAGQRCGDQTKDTGDSAWPDQYGFTRSTFISLSTMLLSNPTVCVISSDRLLLACIYIIPNDKNGLIWFEGNYNGYPELGTS